jgi:glycosyltransferase involved in cell wall biosynthesis
MSLLIDKPGNRKIRVLILTDEMEVGGTQRQIVHMARSLDRDRFEATVAYFCNRSFLADELEKAGVRVVEIPKRGRVDFGFVRNLIKFLNDGQFDVIHCFAFTGELWGAIARRFVSTARRPALITSVRNKYDWYTGLQWRIKRWAALESAHVIANSRAGGEHARECMRLPAGAVEVVYNGVADISRGVIARSSSAASSKVAALFVGRLVEQKNVPVLLRATRILRDRGCDVLLKLAGDGPLRKDLEGQVASLGLGDAIEFLGERTDTPALMAACDFVVSPSFREGLSNVILEAMMMGRPVIASAVGGSVELVHPNETGLLFPSDNETALADAMQVLIEDRVMREKLGQMGRKHAVERYTVEAMVKTMEAFYASCISTNKTVIASCARG